MPIESEQLDRQSLLLLYAAGEMAPEQALALEAQLAADSSMAAELQRVRELMSRADQTIQACDQLQRPPVSATVAVRRAGRAMQQWSVDRMRARIQPQKKVTAIPWWIYPGAAAAILIVGFLVWSGRQEVTGLWPDGPTTLATDDGNASPAPSETEDLANHLDATFEPANTSVAVATEDAVDDSGAFFISPREEQAQ